MENSSKKNFIDYLKGKDIEIIGSMPNVYLKINEENIIKQMKLINDFHKRVMGYDNIIGKKIEDKRGRVVEQYKIYTKKFKREMDFVRNKEDINSFEKMFLQYGEEYLNRAKKCINDIYNNNYLNLLRRSMDRMEICLYDCYFTNLRDKNGIKIVDVSKCSYDMVEIDAVKFLNKIKKKKSKLNLKKCINEFCKVENLNSNSKGFIEALTCYPYEFIKCYMKYKKNKYKIDEFKYKSKLEKIILSYEEF